MEIDRASRQDVFKASRMPTAEDLLRENRLRWFGHLTREDDNEPANQMFWREKEHNSKWFQLLSSDLTSKENFIRKGSIFGVKQINLEKIKFSDV